MAGPALLDSQAKPASYRFSSRACRPCPRGQALPGRLVTFPTTFPPLPLHKPSRSCLVDNQGASCWSLPSQTFSGRAPSQDHPELACSRTGLADGQGRWSAVPRAAVPCIVSPSQHLTASASPGRAWGHVTAHRSTHYPPPPDLWASGCQSRGHNGRTWPSSPKGHRRPKAADT